ncbi:MAG: HAMP domain-containing histidine kinase, partial [Pedobacter sp.]
MTNAVKQLHSKLIGDVGTTSIQARIFHEICIMAIMAITVILIINMFIRVPNVNVILIATLLVIGAVYYSSKFRGNLKSSVAIFTISSNILLVINFIYNSGVNGPTLLLFMLSVVFTISVMPGKASFFWVPLNACVVITLLAFEYYYPQTIVNSYETRAGFFIDTASSYLAVVACLVIVLSYFIKSHQMEKMKAINASTALKEANDAKTKLLSILSHDLRSPLNSIQSFLEILIDMDLEEDERKAIKKSLLKETKNTQTMLFNLLSWTKAQMDGGVKVNLVKLNLYEVMETCIEMQQTSAAEKKISIRNRVEPHTCITADLDMLKLVIRNLLNNAIKFTRNGGEIVAESKESDGMGILTLKDNGIGIAADN